MPRETDAAAAAAVPFAAQAQPAEAPRRVPVPVPQAHLGHFVAPPPCTSLELVLPRAYGEWPMYRVMGLDGHVEPGAELPDLSVETWHKFHTIMLQLRAADDVFMSAQRQGRVSFYMASTGEEAMHVGSAAALSPSDVVFGQYRELGVLFYRGFPMQGLADQLVANEDDYGSARQMGVHVGSKEHNFFTISSPLATQLPQAVGAAYALKHRRGLEGAGSAAADSVAVAYIGEGAASEGDAYVAMNFAATLDLPVVFFVRNNGYAISTPAREQYRGDGVVSRCAGFGMAGVRVDGNDVHAVYAATKAAREMALRESRPVLIEAMSYRVGHHSTSDDSTRYRDPEEMEAWKSSDPLLRLERFLRLRGLSDEVHEARLRDAARVEVLRALEEAERKPKPTLEKLFTDVYHDVPKHIREQEEGLMAHLAAKAGQ